MKMMNTGLALGLAMILAVSGCGYLESSIKIMDSPSGSYKPCALDAVTTAPCLVEKTNLAVVETMGSDVSTFVNSLAGTSISAALPTAFYENKTVTFTDGDLLAANIVSGIEIFGVTGTANGPYALCTDEALNAGACSTPANRYVTGSVGGNVTAWFNAGGTTTVGGTIPLGFYAGNSIDFTDSNLLAGNIKSGVSIFNVLGSYTGSGGGGVASLMSNMHRDKTTTQISQDTEAISNSGNAYQNSDPGYRAVPKITKDDEGSTGGSVTRVSRTNWDTACDATTGAGGGTSNSPCKCGLSGTISQRVADCAAHTVIGDNATWDGSTKGNAGQGVWKLVTRTGAVNATKGREVWRDERTNLLWSSLVSTSLNWCKASGSNFITNNPTAENDPNDYCDNATYQTTGTGPADKAVSACFEDGNNYFTSADAGIDNAGKAGLDSSSTPRVDWRLASEYDYKQADINGFRFVMPDTTSSSYWEWSGTVLSSDRIYVFLFVNVTGAGRYDSRVLNFAVRCVGR